MTAEVSAFGGKAIEVGRNRLPVAGRAEHVARMVVSEDKQKVGPARLRHSERGGEARNYGAPGGAGKRHLSMIRGMKALQSS